MKLEVPELKVKQVWQEVCSEALVGPGDVLAYLDALPGLPFPLRNHVGVQVMLGSELGHRLVADQRFQGDFGLEYWAEKLRRFPMSPVLP